MKLLHLSDLHFGKTLFAQPLIADQQDWCAKLYDAVRREKPDAVLIAGDVYDRGVPSREAVQLLSRLLTDLSQPDETIGWAGVDVLLIAGNHDGGERLEFAANILENQRVHIAGTVQEAVKKVRLGDVNFWLLPCTTPAAVRVALNRSDEEISSYSEAIAALLAEQEINWNERNVLIAHQTVVNGKADPLHGASETAIGGVGGVQASLFQNFDYVALGHIHQAQAVGSPKIRYSGAPLCYHFDEADDEKGLLWVTLGKKGSEPVFKTEALPPLHRVRRTVKGRLQQIVDAEADNPARGDYVRVVLTDDTLPPNARQTLETLYASHADILLDVSRERRSAAYRAASAAAEAETRSLADDFRAFCRSRGDGLTDPGERELALIRFLAEQVENRRDADEETLTAELVEEALRLARADSGEAGKEAAQ